MAGYEYSMIIGNVGSDAVMRQTQGGINVTSFSVAVGKTWKDKDTGEKKESTKWFKVTAWRGLGETCNTYVKKGMQVMVVGDVKASAYIDKQGNAASSLELTAQTVQFLGRKGDNEAGGGGYTPSDADAPPEDGGGYNYEPAAKDPDDIPF